MSTFVGQSGGVTQRAPGASTDDAGVRAARATLRPIRRESKLTLGGVVYIAVTVFLAVGAINSQNNLLFWLFGVAIATLIVSGIFSGNALMKLRLEARALHDVRAGELVRLSYTLKNHSRFFPLFAAMISEVPRGDAALGRYEPAAVIHLGPRRSVTVTGTFTPAQRGRCMLRTIRLSTRFPFGLLQKALVFEQPRSLMVLPYPLVIRPELVRITQGQGEEARRRSDGAGTGSEYWGLREYRPGDPRKSIAWKQSARRSALVVVEHAQPISTRLWVWVAGVRGELDQRGRVHQERAIALAAALVSAASERGAPVGLWIPSRGLRIPCATGRAHRGRCLRALTMIDLDQDPSADAPPPIAKSDDVLTITADDHPLQLGRQARRLSVGEPEQWLADPASLPRALTERGA